MFAVGWKDYFHSLCHDPAPAFPHVHAFSSGTSLGANTWECSFSSRLYASHPSSEWVGQRNRRNKGFSKGV